MEARQGQIDDAHRAIGEYVVEFSQLVFAMREMMIAHLTHPGAQHPVVSLVFGELTAQTVANAFFGMCAMVAEFDEDEVKVAAAFRGPVNATIERRNYFAHGDWRVWGDPAMLDRVKPVRKKGPFEATNMTAADLIERVSELRELRRAVTEFGQICIGRGFNHYRLPPDAPKPTRVRDIFVMDGKDISRGGPWAYLAFWQPYE